MKNLTLALAAALLLSACSKPAVPTAPGENSETYFRLPGAAGGEIDLAASAGKPVLLMFFTETCGYCRKAAPFIQTVHSRYGGKGLDVIGVCIQDRAQTALNFAAETGITFPLAYKGREIFRRYNTRGVPYIFLLTREHEVYDVWEGYDNQYDQSIIDGVETVLAVK